MEKMIKLGIDARGISENSGGVKQFIDSFIDSLIKVIPSNFELIIFYNSNNYLYSNKKYKGVKINCKSKLLYDYVYLPYKANKMKLDWIILPKTNCPYLLNAKKIIIVHDLLYFNKNLIEFSLINNMYERFSIKRSILNANIIVTVSNFTKNELLKYFKCLSFKKIYTIYEAPDPKYNVTIDNKNILKEFNINGNYIFYPGSLSPRKNIIRVLNAFLNLNGKIKQKLVFTAGKSWKDSEIIRLLENKNLKDRVIKLGHVNDDIMPYLYKYSDLCIYPSLYEGFGLPILEAQACGCPVITSNLSSCPEIASDGAHIINPYSVEDIKDGIIKILNDVKYKENLIKKGFDNVSKFSWIKTAMEYINLIKKYEQ